MKKSLPLFIVPIMLFALSQGLKAQDQSPKYFFQGVERLNSKAGFRYVYDAQNKIKASVYYDSQGKIPHVDSIMTDRAESTALTNIRSFPAKFPIRSPWILVSNILMTRRAECMKELCTTDMHLTIRPARKN